MQEDAQETNVVGENRLFYDFSLINDLAATASRHFPHSFATISRYLRLYYHNLTTLSRYITTLIS